MCYTIPILNLMVKFRTGGGFTLIELLVVIAIIGILSTLAVVALNSARQKARDATRMSDVREMQKALEFYFGEGENNQYPNGTINGQAQDGVLGPPDRSKLSVDNGFAAAAAGKELMSKVPGSPIPPDVTAVPENVYRYAGAASNYVISFYLERATGGLPAGLNCIDQNGLHPATGNPAACPAP